MMNTVHFARFFRGRQTQTGRVTLTLSVLILLATGCAEVTVRRAHNSVLLDDQRSSLADSGSLSARTIQTLRQLDLEHLYHHRPVEALARLRALTVDDPQPERVFALAEMSHDLGRKAEADNQPDAAFFYYLSAGFAYRYLIPASPDSSRSQESGVRGQEARVRSQEPQGEALSPDVSFSSTFDPQFRLACDLYNTSLARFLRLTVKVGPLDPNQPLVIRTSRGTSLTLSVERQGFPWRPEEFGDMMFCGDYRVEGLENQHHSYGLGVPLMCERARVSPKMAHAAYPRDWYFPVTAFLRFDGNIGDLGARASLQLVNPLAEHTALVEGKRIPLESDLTTPVAYGLSKSDAYLLQYEGFLSADKLKHKTGIYMLEPYQAGKIPVLFIHGLLSSPATWAKMYNDLEADPVIRKRYQFWGYFYATGDPYFLTAADLRQRLVALRTELDPQHSDQALDDMICVGHSMGGLISKLLTVDSGDSFWRLVSARPLDSLKLDPIGREELRRLFYFQAEPSVRRVIFLATPHHGSSLSRIGPARLADQVIRLPKGIVQAKYELARDNPNEVVFAKGRIPTSVDLLQPGSPCLELLASEPKPNGVHFHSIIGALPPDESWINFITPVSRHGKEKSDGIVSYSSSHLDGVDSELVVPADHLEVHQHALSILEVRRILLEHLQQRDGN